MKKLVFLACGIVLALNLGCMLVDVAYPPIVDAWYEGPFLVNTNGKAHVFESVQTIEQLPTGYWVGLVAFVDQDAKGMQTLTTYEVSKSTMTYFHSDTYCSPDWNGCPFVTTKYDPFSYDCSWAGLNAKFNFNCVSVSFTGLCTTYRYGECGRGVLGTLPIADAYSLIGLGTGTTFNGREALRYMINGRNCEISLTGGSQTVSMNLKGNASAVYIPSTRKAHVDVTDPLMAYNLRNGSQKLSDLHSTTVLATITYEGISHSFTIPGKGLNSLYEKSANSIY